MKMKIEELIAALEEDFPPPEVWAAVREELTSGVWWRAGEFIHAGARAGLVVMLLSLYPYSEDRAKILLKKLVTLVNWYLLETGGKLTPETRERVEAIIRSGRSRGEAKTIEELRALNEPQR